MSTAQSFSQFKYDLQASDTREHVQAVPAEMMSQATEKATEKGRESQGQWLKSTWGIQNLK